MEEDDEAGQQPGHTAVAAEAAAAAAVGSRQPPLLQQERQQQGPGLYGAGPAGSGSKSSVTKWYAVVVGRHPGLYTSWTDCAGGLVGWGGGLMGGLYCGSSFSVCKGLCRLGGVGCLRPDGCCLSLGLPF
jgi:hypothetical protein